MDLDAESPVAELGAELVSGENGDSVNNSSVEIVLDSREAAKAWIIKHQLGRQNLNESQRAMLATTLE
jgi:hypothetical protein